MGDIKTTVFFSYRCCISITLASCSVNKITRLYLVTAPKHAPRAHQEFLIAKQRGRFKGITAYSVASDVDFPNTDVSQVAILEPWHRWDLPKWNQP